MTRLLLYDTIDTVDTGDTYVGIMAQLTQIIVMSYDTVNTNDRCPDS